MGKTSGFGFPDGGGHQGCARPRIGHLRAIESRREERYAQKGESLAKNENPLQ